MTIDIFMTMATQTTILDAVTTKNFTIEKSIKH